MANYLEVAVIESMVLLSARGWSQRRIARELAVSREAVSRYLALREAEADVGPDPLLASKENQPRVPAGCEAVPDLENQPRVPAGSEVPLDVENQPRVPAGSEVPLDVENQPRVPAGFERSQSQCLGHAQAIAEMVAAGLTAQRIWQELVANQAFGGSYDAVKRYVRRLREVSPEPFRRL